MVKLNAHGEVADFQDASQFAPNESEFACGEFAGAIVKFAGYPEFGSTGFVFAKSFNPAPVKIR